MVQSLNRVSHFVSHKSKNNVPASDSDRLDFNYKLHEDTFGIDSEFARNKMRHEYLAIE